MKELKEKGIVDMWYSKGSDGYTYNVKNNKKGAYEASLIDFFYSEQDRINIRKEKVNRLHNMRSETTPC
ncbi:hypothetical protein RGC52_07610 [Helicobacter pylori]|uniref:hypothetical protein n=1 Tax=Helicobacter pylori TaxID=210 RepID=UPI0029299349|nr:hypothetical protein [Helicobacter pylori]MDU9711565.1 hypothetical protein [Helicobacter pylori]